MTSAARGLQSASCAQRKIAAAREAVGEGLEVLRALPAPGLEAVGPFVFLDHMGPARPPDGGVPAHPHAGIEVITYLLEGENEHRDSFGNHSFIEAGGAQWIATGRGMLHAEFPRGGGNGLMQGVQMWIRQRPECDDKEPRYAAFAAGDFPQREIQGVRLRLLAGAMPAIFSAPGPIPLGAPALLVHLTLPPGVQTTLPLKDAFEMAVYALTGVGRVEGEKILGGELALLSPAPTATIANAGVQPLEMLLFGGAPAPRPLVFRGPFVFNSFEASERAQGDYAAGRMGRLDGTPF